MNEDVLFVPESELSRLERSIPRIESKFNVSLHISRQDNANGNGTGRKEDSCEISLLISPNSQESARKAKKYIRSFIGKDPELERKTQKFSVSGFNMLLEKHDLIEQISQAYLEFLVNKHEICITGVHEGVCLAQTVMEAMLQETSVSDGREYTSGSKQSEQLLPDTNCLGTIGTTESLGDQFVSVDGEIASPYRTQTIEDVAMVPCVEYGHRGNTNNPAWGKPLCTTEENVLDVNHSSGNSANLGCSDLDKSDFELSFPQLDFPSQNSLTNSYNNETDRIQNEPGYSDKLEFAIKLGYTEDNLLVSLRKLGPGAGQNELLSELIKLDSGKYNSEGTTVTDDDDNLFSNEHSDSYTSAERVDEGFCEDGNNLRPIVIDGSNVAMSHGNKEVFSCQGIKLAVHWFRQYGHTEITVFVPQWRKEMSRPDAPIKDQDILTDLEKEKVLVFTPARRIGGKRVVCYDDRYILKLAAEVGGIVVSNDNYRDLLNENPEYRKVVEERLLMYSFVNDRFMPPDDPLGRHGPSLENFLRKEPTIPEPLPPLCPYGSKKCTYGNKCKFYHPERGNLPHKSVTEKLAEQAKQKIQEVRVREAGAKTVDGEKRQSAKKNKLKPQLHRTSSITPGDIGSGKEPATPSKPDRIEHYRQYEERLNKFRKQFELAQKAESESVETVVSNADPVLIHPGYIDPLPTHKAGSKCASPIPRVQTPPQIIKPRQEQLITGHLLLAKKLSDESIDHKFRLNEDGDSEEEESAAQAVTDQTGHLAVAGQMANTHIEQSGHLTVIGQIEPTTSDQPRSEQSQTGHIMNNSPGEQMRSRQAEQLNQTAPERQQLQQSWSSDCSPREQQTLHSKLSRQMSLAGNQDPRLHPQVQHQLSVEPQLCTSNESSYNTRSLPVNRRHEVGMYSAIDPERVASFPMTAAELPILYSHHGQSRNNYYGNVRTDEVFHSGDQTPLTQMMSAPHLNQLSSGHQRSHTNQHGMVRQNSNSDSQLHMIGVCDVDSFNTPYSYNQCGTVYGGDIAIDPNGYPTTPQQQQQQPFLRSTSMVQPHYRQNLNSRSARHYSDGRFGGIDQSQVNLPYLQPSHMYTQPQPQFVTSDQTRQQYTSQPTQLNYQQMGGSVTTPTQHLPDPSIIGHNPGQLSNVSVWSDSPYSAPVSNLRAPMPDDTEIKPKDTRYNLYYHLCGLFPEPKVRAVMNQYPNETNPQELCAYIIGFK
ncbi:hypothetical protein ScPMuIL_012794 [Solemya velum]